MTQFWEPLLHGEDRDLSIEIVRTFAAIARDAPATGRRGLMGPTGIALFLAQAEAQGVDEDSGALGVLELGLTELTAGTSHLGLWTGASGLRWAVSQIADGDAVNELFAHVDDAIQRRLIGPTPDDYDSHSGLASVLFAYADDQLRGNQVVAQVLDHLERLDLACTKRNEVGFAHGISGVLGALACCRAHGRTDDRIQPMMLAIIDALEHIEVVDQRIGWCRGEPGIAIALLGAAHTLRWDDLARQAVRIALAPFERCHGRWPVTPDLCHGAAGLAHIYNRMYQATGDGRLGEHAHTWLRNTIAMVRTGNEIWRSDISLLSGVAGVGLALLGGAASAVPTWDRVLGADIPGPASRN